MLSFILSEARASVALDGDTQSEVTADVRLGMSQWQLVIDAINDSIDTWENLLAGKHATEAVQTIKQLEFIQGLINREMDEALAPNV